MPDETSSVKPNKRRSGEGFKIAIAGLVVIVLCGVSFMAGMTFQKNQTSKSTAQSAQLQNDDFGGREGMGRNRMSGDFGTVTTVSSSSITVQNTRTDTTTTYTIDTSTTVKNGTTAAVITDVKVGDTVLVQTSSSDKTKATSITINPQMPSMNGGPQQNENGSRDSI